MSAARLKTLRAKIAAAHLYEDDGTDRLVWHGLEYRDVDYDAVLDRTGPIVLRSVVFDIDRGRFAIDPLGEQAFVQVVHGENPSWLQASLKGCVVLDAKLAAPILAQAPGKFQCEDEDHARWLVESKAVEMEKLLVPRRTAA
jgi:hypothetical protein